MDNYLIFSQLHFTLAEFPATAQKLLIFFLIPPIV